MKYGRKREETQRGRGGMEREGEFANMKVC